MAKKRTKADKLQRNVARLATRDEARREAQLSDQRSEPTGKTPGPPKREAEAETPGSKKTALGTRENPPHNQNAPAKAGESIPPDWLLRTTAPVPGS
jgi:hypothetical protein